MPVLWPGQLPWKSTTRPPGTPGAPAPPGFAARLTETAREAGATNPEQLGEQLALLLDGASARNRVLNTETFATAAAIAVVLIDSAIPIAAVPPGAGGSLSAGTGPRADPAASSAEVDAEGEVVVPRAMAAHAYRQQAGSLEPVRHAQVAGVPRTQS